MFDDDLLEYLLSSLRAGGVDTKSPQRIALTAIGFRSADAADACAGEVAAIGLAVLVREDEPISIDELEQAFAEAGMTSDPLSDETGPNRSWSVEATAEILVDKTELAQILKRIEVAAAKRGGFLCSLRFPSSPRRAFDGGNRS